MEGSPAMVTSSQLVGDCISNHCNNKKEKEKETPRGLEVVHTVLFHFHSMETVRDFQP